MKILHKRPELRNLFFHEEPLQPVEYDNIGNVPSAKVKVSVAGGFINLEVEEETGFGKSASGVSAFGTHWKRIYTEENEALKIRHNLICQSLMGSMMSDEPLRHILGLEKSKLTPDYIAWNPDTHRWEIIEVGTVSSWVHLDSSYRSKYRKYSSALLSSKEDFYLGILLIAPDKLQTNLNLHTLTEGEIQDLFSHFWLGDQFLSALQQKNIMWKGEKFVRLLHDQISESIISLKDIPLPKDSDPLIITQKLIDKWDYRVEVEHELFKSLVSATSQKMVTINPVKDYNLDVKNFLADLGGTEHRPKQSMKAIIQFPVLMTKDLPLNLERIDWSGLRVNSSGKMLSDIWLKAMSFAINNHSRFEDDPVSETRWIDSRDEVFPFEKVTDRKSKSHRSYFQTNRDESALLHSMGVKSKKSAKALDDVLFLMKKESQKPFSMESSTDDIDLFLSVEILEVLRKSPVLFNSESMLPLLHLGGFDDDLELTSLYNKLSITRWFNSMYLVSRVSEELNLSLKQFCQTNEFVLKQVFDLPILLLIKPHNGSSSLSFSIAYSSDYLSSFSLAKQPEDFIVINGVQWNVLPFLYVNRHKLSIYLRAEPFSYNCFCMWQELFRLHPSSVDFNNASGKSLDVIQHFFCSMLFYLEGKNQTSTNAQLIRYAYMEVTKGNPHSLRPGKIFAKLDVRPRSRLLVWMYKRIVKSFSLMTEIPPVNMDIADLSSDVDLNVDSALDAAEDANVSLDDYNNLISWVTLREIPNFELALNLSYFGSLHNKDEADEKQGNRRIFEKVIDQELKLRDARTDYMGWFNPDIKMIRNHEFHHDFVSACGHRIFEWIRLNKSVSPREFVRSKIIEALSKERFEDLATLKASAVIRDYSDLLYNDSAMINLRERVIGNVINLMKEMSLTKEHNNCPYVYLKYVFKLVSERGYRANLFRKLQIGGVREIFVLDIYSRVATHCCEIIARTINEMLPNEMLTKGTQKLKKTEIHFTKVAKIKRSKSYTNEVTNIDSDDASTWAQQFVMPVFSCLMKQILTPDLYHLFNLGMNACTNKLLELPHSVLHDFIFQNKLKEKLKTESLSDFNIQMKNLESQFLNRDGPHDLVIFRGRYLKNRSNMMQGIHHFVSSTMHAGAMLEYSHFCQAFLQVMKKKNIIHMDTELVISTKVSSDDSSALKTLVSTKSSKSNMMGTLHFMSVMKGNLYPLFCARLSVEKSTSSSFSGIEEFNSTWFIRNTIQSPIIKFVYAASHSHVALRLEDRLEVFSNLRKQLYENGASSLLTAMVQLQQSFIHYTDLGLHTNPMFNRFKLALMDKPHPALGLFLFEPTLYCGLFGNNLSRYLLLKSNSLSRRVEKALMTKDLWDPSVHTSPSMRLILNIGNFEKYEKFKRRFAQVGWKNDLTVEMLYRSSQNVRESEFWMQKKIHTPSTAEAFSFNSLNRLHQTSVYVLQRPSMVVWDVASPEEKGKTPLIKLIERLELKDEVTEEYLKQIFPQNQFYNYLLEYNQKTRRSMELFSTYNKLKSKLIEIKLSRSVIVSPLSLKSTVRHLWFSNSEHSSKHKIHSTETEKNISLQVFSSALSWLLPDPDESLKLSPFRDHLAMSDFIKSYEQKNLSINVVGPVRRGLSFNDTIQYLVVNNYSKSGVLRHSQPIVDKALSSQINGRLVLIKSSFLEPPSKVRLYDEVLKGFDSLYSESNILESLITLSRRDSVLAIFQAVSKGHLKSESLEAALSIVKKGTRGYFSKRQHFNNGRYFGEGIMEAAIDDVKLRVKVLDSTVTEILCSQPNKLWEYQTELTELLKSIGSVGTNRVKGFKLFYDFSSLRVTAVEGYNCAPISLSNNLTGPLIMKSEIGVESDFSSNLRLTMSIRKGNTNTMDSKITIMKFSPAQFLFSDPTFDIPNLRPVTHAWVNFRELSLQDSFYLMLDSLDEGDSKMVSWCSDTLIAKVRGSLQESPGFLKVKDAESMLLDEKFDAFINSETIDLEEMGIKLEFYDEDDEDEEEAESILSTFIEVGYPDKEVERAFSMFNSEIGMSRAVKVDISKVHPFWNSVLNRLSETDNVKELIVGKYYYAENSDIARLVGRIVGNNSRPRKQEQVFRRREGKLY